MSDLLTLPDRCESGAVILVSGGRQVGKTTLLLRLRQAALEAGLPVGGFLSVARFDGADKTGIDLLDAASGAVFPLAVIGGEGAIRTGHYSFNPAALEAGQRFAQAGQTAGVFFVDELGPLELVRDEGWATVIPLVRARTFGLALVVVRPELVDLARERLGLPPDTPVIMVDESNRDRLGDRLADWIGCRASPD